MRNRFPVRGTKVTISDVAEAAGVSKGTVSKYLGGGKEYYVAEATSERIAAAIKTLGFQPNAIAQGLSRQRSNTVGVVVASITNPFYPELIAGIQEITESNEFTLLLGSTDGQPAKEAGIVQSMMQRQVDGLIMASVTMHDREVGMLVESGVDVVLASRGLSRTLVDTVMIDNEAGGWLITNHLLEHGHRRIAHLAGAQNIWPMRLRRNGYRRALKEAGIAYDDNLVVPAGSGSGSLSASMTSMLDRTDPPTAVFVANDRLALEVLQFCADRQINVPGALAVAGFDNVWVGGLPGVGLTTIDSKARRVGRTAAQLLTERIRSRHLEMAGPAGPENVTLAPDLVLRRSCGCHGL